MSVTQPIDVSTHSVYYNRIYSSFSVRSSTQNIMARTINHLFKIKLVKTKTLVTWVACLFFLLCHFANVAQERQVRSSGLTFNVYLKGFENRKANEPAIIFESGMGTDLGNWDTVIDQLAKVAPVFCYDRLNIGKSEKVYELPTVTRVAENLKALLTSLNIAPPYLLVGHSLGGVYIRAYAGLFQKDVAGLVFIDPADFTESKEEWNNIFRKIGVSEERINVMLQRRLYDNIKIDSAHYGPSSESFVLTDLRRGDFAELETLPVPVVPMCFFVGGKFEVPVAQRSTEFDHEKFFIVKTNTNMEHWRAFIDASPKGGSIIYLSKCGHFVHRDDPDMVVSTISSMIKKL